VASFSLEKLLSIDVGRKFKSYRDMCECIDAPYLKDNSRKSQIKEWEQYVKLKVNKTGSITVLEVYENPVKKVDKRENGNNKVYMDLVKLILLDYLRSNIDEEVPYVCLTKGGLYELLGFVNDDYMNEFIRKYKIDSQHKNSVTQFKEEYNVTPFDMNNFYEHSRLKFDSIISRAIKDMVEDFILFVNPAFMITEYQYTEYNMRLKQDILERLKTEDISEVQLYNMLNKFELVTTRIAEGNEISRILEVTREALDSFKFERMFDAYKNKESANLFRDITSRLLEEMDWIFCYKTIKFQFTEKTIESGMRISERSVEKHKSHTKKLNSLIKDAVNQSAVSAYNNNLKKQEQIESDALNNILSDDKVFRFKDNYIEVRQALVEYFMSLEKDEKSKN
jgi:hypothetical protein